MDVHELGEKNKAIPAWIRLCVALPLIGLAAYWVFDYHGVYKWLAELEIKLFGGYYAFITGMLTF